MIGAVIIIIILIVLAKTKSRENWAFIRAPCSVWALFCILAAGIEYAEKDYIQEIQMIGVGFLAGIALWYMMREQRIKEQENWKKRMLLEYPEFVSKLSLLLGAGMTVLSAFTRMDKTYGKFAEDKAKKLHPAYVLLHQMLIDIDNGKSQQRAYQSFGENCKLQPYRKLASLILSCQQMGNKKLTRQLNEEADRVFSERKHLARKLGEEAGIKMLFPMMLMMLLIMGIILVPAMISLNI